MDVWILDVRAGRLTQLPGMPALVALKATSMAWTHDGRLVLLGVELGVREREFVAVWRPGQSQLFVRTVRLPKRPGSNDLFAPLR